MTQEMHVDIVRAVTDRDSADYGFSWETESVAERHGPNDSDKVTVNTAAQIAVMTDVAKFDKAFPGYILGMSDGTSLRVSCQRVSRKFTDKQVVECRKAVMEHLKGVRVRVAATPRRGLPDGTYYTGTDEITYRQSYIAALQAQGCPSDVALTIGKALPW